eukprot:scaffold221505_cov18-Tisochrysis_lutea.AAC.1
MSSRLWCSVITASSKSLSRSGPAVIAWVSRAVGTLKLPLLLPTNQETVFQLSWHSDGFPLHKAQ